MAHGETADKFNFLTSMQDRMLHYKHVGERNEPVKTRKNKLYSNSNVDRHDGLHHIPKKIEGRLVCVLCSALSQIDRADSQANGALMEYKKPSRSKFKCSKCNVALCVARGQEGDTTCFERYHADKRIEGIDFNVKKNIRQKKKGLTPNKD